MTPIKRTEINAILSEDFDELLAKLGALQEFEAGICACVVCGDRLSRQNVRIVFPASENSVGFVCDRPECVAKYRSGERE